MHSSIRNFALPLGFAAVAVLGACNSEATDRSKDVLAQDSTLDLAVLNASGDSVGQASGDTNVGTSSAPSQVASAPSSVPDAAPARTVTTTTEPKQTIAAAPARVSTSASRTLTHRSRSGRLVSVPRTTASRTIAVPTRTPTRTPARRQARVLHTTRGAAASTVIASAPSENSSAPVPARVRTNRATSAVIPTGSSFSLVTEQKICASSAKVGDSFNASLAKEVISPSGVVIPAGTSATGEVVSTAGRNSTMRVALKSIDFDGHSYPVSSDVTFTDMQAVKIKPKGGSASRILAGAGIGALIGRMMGGSAKSTIIGAAGGAAAGGVVAAKSVHYDQCVPQGGQIIAHLAQPLRVQVGD